MSKKHHKKRPLRGPAPGLRWTHKVAIGGGLALALLVFLLWWSGLIGKGVAAVDMFWTEALKTRGFVLQDILLQGRQKLTKEDVLQALQVKPGAGIFEVDPALVRERLEALPWVATVSVERLLPSRLVLHVEERSPIALWQHDGKLDLLGEKKVVIPCPDPLKYAYLPQLVGVGADVYGEHFLKVLKQYPKTLSYVKSIVRVSNRRWDLHLKNTMIIKLPDLKYKNALKKFERLIEDKNILNRGISIMDFRLPGKFIVQYKEVEKS